MQYVLGKCVNVFTCIHTHTLTHAHTHTHTHTRTHTHTHKHTHTHTHAHTHTHTHTNKHTQRHTLIQGHTMLYSLHSNACQFYTQPHLSNTHVHRPRHVYALTCILCAPVCMRALHSPLPACIYTLPLTKLYGPLT